MQIGLLRKETLNLGLYWNNQHSGKELPIFIRNVYIYICLYIIYTYIIEGLKSSTLNIHSLIYVLYGKYTFSGAIKSLINT